MSHPLSWPHCQVSPLSAEPSAPKYLPVQSTSRARDLSQPTHDIAGSSHGDISRPPENMTPTYASSASSYYLPFVNSSPESTAFRESLASHATAQFSRRHRTFFFQLVVINRWARFIRWDRSGAISTERFDFVSEPDILATFLWQFAHLTDEQKGLDSTVTLANRCEKDVFKDAVREFLEDIKAGTKDGAPVRVLPNVERTLANEKAYPVWKIHMVDAATRKSTNLIVGRPFYETGAMFGRATRAYIAYDLHSERLIFLKDTWRPDHPKLRAESETYQDLKRHNVRHIPNVLYAGDVRNIHRRLQDTVTQMFAKVKDEWRVTNCKLERHIHHRVVQDIAYPLESALDARELLQALHDSLIGAFPQCYPIGA